MKQLVVERASDPYYWDPSLYNCNDIRVASNLYEQRYAGNWKDVLDCTYGTTSMSAAVAKANSMGDEGFAKLIECRKIVMNSLTYHQTTQENIDAYRKAALKRIDDHNSDWLGGGTIPFYPDTGYGNLNFSENMRAVRSVMNPKDDNWFLQNLGQSGSIKNPTIIKI